MYIYIYIYIYILKDTSHHKPRLTQTCTRTHTDLPADNVWMTQYTDDHPDIVTRV